MLRHFLILALRNIKRKATFSILNIAGFSIGLSACFVVMLYVFQETSYERGFAQHNDTYRIYTKFLNASFLATSSINLRDALIDQPEIEDATGVGKLSPLKELEVRGSTFNTVGYLTVDDSFLKVFNFDLLYGDAQTALASPNALVLSVVEAERLFGRKDVVGEVVRFNKEEVLITGVLKPTLFKTHIQFNALLTQKKSPFNNKSWVSLSAYTYAVLNPNISEDQLDARLDYIMKDHIFPGLLEALPIRDGYTFEEWEQSASNIRNYAQPIDEIYLASDLSGEWSEGGDRKTVVAFAIVACFILIISCANFINLTTAKASDRAKEIGIKKVLGFRRTLLIQQLIFEAILVTLIAGVFSFGLTELALKGVNELFPDFISISLIEFPQIIAVLVVFVLVIGCLSACYPAFYLSSFKTTALLKGQKVKGFKGASGANKFRSVLVVVQFSLSTILIIGSISMFKQLRHIKEIDLGFNGEEVLVIPDAVKLGDKLEVFQTELSRLSFVDNSSGLLRLPGEEGSPIKVEMSTDSGDRFYVDQFIGDTQMLDVLGVELLYGQFFSDSLKASNTTIVINETMASYLDTDQVLGTNFDGYEVIGVVEDFHFGSLREQIGPLIFSQSSRSKALAIKMPINQTNIASIERLWQSMSGLPMKYYPLEDNYEAIVGKEYSTGQAFSLFTILAIFISCLGMYGLTAFAADQRAKEFGIRKVLGASMGDLVKTLTNSLSKLMLISFVLAVPLSYLAVNKWLSDFAYRIEMTSIIFLVGCFIVLVLITLTVFHQSYKVVVKNPVDSLKND